MTGKCYGTAVGVHPRVGDEVCKPPVVKDSIAEIQNDKTPDKDIIKNTDGKVPTEILVEFIVAFDRDDNDNKDDVGLGTLEHLNGGVSKGIQIDDMFFSEVLSVAACNRDTSILTRANHLDTEHFNDKLSEVSEDIETLKGPYLVDIVKNCLTVSSCDV